MSAPIPFNKPFIAGKELYYIAQAVTRGNLAEGYFTRQCCTVLEEFFRINCVMLVPSCTAALEMAAMLCDLGPGDEVIMPSYTFVSTANAVVLRGAKPVFVDIRADTLNIDETKIEAAITKKTKAIFPVHYAGVAAEMNSIMHLADAYDLVVVEDAAQGVNAFYQGRALGSIGHLGCYSFHATKNYISGEGGALCVNVQNMIERAAIIRDKGTNRAQFLRNQVDKYTWVDLGSSYIPSEIVSAFLYGQLELMDQIRGRRKGIFNHYHTHFAHLEACELLRRPIVPNDCEPNYHMYYILLPSLEVRDALLSHLNRSGIGAAFHYVPLHTSPMGMKVAYHEGGLTVTEEMSGRLLRLPLYYDIRREDQDRVITCVNNFLTASPSRSRGVLETSTS
jgi:dTDP-4-amino-4,6-dideoxygalactose transaminase